MARNLDVLGGLLLSESVMLALGEKIGKQTAHEVVYAIAMKAHEEGIPFRDALLADEQVASHLSHEDIERLLDPAAYIGLAPALVDGVTGLRTERRSTIHSQGHLIHKGGNSATV